MSSSVLVLEGLSMADSAKGSMMRGFRFNLLTWSPEGTRNALLITRSCVNILPICLPPGLFKQSLSEAVRPAELPGPQLITTEWGTQAGCTNDTMASPLQRCWAGVYRAQDVAMAAAELDAASNPVPVGYNIQMLDTSWPCVKVLDEECVRSLGPLGCMLVTMNRDGAATPPPPPDDRALPAESPHASAGQGRDLFPILAGCIVGGTAFLVLAGVAAALAVRRSRRRSSRGQADPSAQQSIPSPAETVPPSSLGKDQGSCQGCSQEPAMHQTHGESASSNDSLHVMQEDPPPPLQALLESYGPVISHMTPLHDELDVNVQVLEADQSSSAAQSGPQTTSIPSGALSSQAQRSCDEATDNVLRLTGRVLGRGASGRVLEGEFRGHRVAAKQLELSVEDWGFGADAFSQELLVLGRCNHPNIVKVLAASALCTARPVIVLELMETSLDKVLYGSPDVVLPMATVLHIARQVAQGLSYLHPTILHRDLKPANVLLSDSHSENPIVKLSDFGLSRLRESALVTTRPAAGTPPYTAPECFDVLHPAITHRADCYSFGVLLWEMLAGAQPWAGMTGVQIAYGVAFQQRRLMVPAHGSPGGGDMDRWPPRLCALLKGCWEAESLRRPAAADMVKVLLLAQQDLKRGRTS
ncbi:hypothetical protein HYH03_007160 [Edaphochlamys debaryana]|uniref:Protein kinase domain-containing protein n=2 Tax=Edaphochlamys debaryana TaxID=47281 RepID=A0A835Y117_9CHLO|nr:hypothetical protein HYH03_007160 [Edaphochlamys debaryana]|eukprot:KAG2494642.1 hypothetical protein HYH03_007160 [Edaphochlamys debaryana]